MADSETSTSLSRISRRHILSDLLTAASGAAFGQTGVERMAAELQMDPALIAWKFWRLAHRRALAWCRRQQRLETELARTIGFPCVTFDAPELPQPVRIGSLQALNELATEVPSIRQMQTFLDAELRAHQARWDNAVSGSAIPLPCSKRWLSLLRRRSSPSDCSRPTRSQSPASPRRLMRSS